MSKPKYLARPSDGSILKRNTNGTYSFIDSSMSKPHEYNLENLLSLDFEVVTEKDFPRLEKKKEVYYEWLSWTTRSDGHGDSKGGTLEEFKKLKGYE